MAKKFKNYPLYETTVFEDFRIMVENVADKYPDKVAVSYKDDPNSKETVQVTYEQARQEIRKYGTALVDLGCREQKCAIIGTASIGWIYSYFALMAIGAVTVPLDKEWPAEDLAATIERAECKYLFYSAEVAPKLDTIIEKNKKIKCVCMWGKGREGDKTIDELIEKGEKLIAKGDKSYFNYEIKRDEVASIVFTSGTTGKGKGVMLSQTNIVSDMTQGMYNFAITPKTMCVLPLHHTFGSTVNLVGHYAQGSEIYISSGLKYIQKELAEQKPTHLILVPLFVETFYKKIWANARATGQEAKLKGAMKLSNGMMKVGIDMRKKLFKSIHDVFGGRCEMIICGGAALNQDIIDTFKAIGITILNGYGITECSPLISCNRNKLQKEGSVGIPIIGELVKIADPNEDGEGEICVKGPNVMLGYYKDEEATKAVFDDEGYFHTGDFGKIDEDGWLYITGRLKNLIILSNGKNIYPEEIETEISRIPGVGEVVVYEGKSKSGKDAIVAEIYPDRDDLKSRKMEIDDLKQYFADEIKKVNARMAPYKAVGYIKVRDKEFIKNTSRKITRFNIDRTIE